MGQVLAELLREISKNTDTEQIQADGCSESRGTFETARKQIDCACSFCPRSHPISTGTSSPQTL